MSTFRLFLRLFLRLQKVDMCIYIYMFVGIRHHRSKRIHGDGKARTRFTDVELLEAKCLRRDARIVSCDEDGRTWKKNPQHYGNHTEASNVTMCSIDLSQNMSSVSTLRRVVWVLSNDVDGRRGRKFARVHAWRMTGSACQCVTVDSTSDSD